MNFCDRRNIFLMGFMGTGKTTVGRHLAAKLNRKFVDTDDLIVEKAHLPIADIFARFGEAYFRGIERDVIRQAVEMTPAVIALGGGAVCDPENWQAIRASGITVTLNCQPAIIVERLQKDQSRPLLNSATDDKLIQIERLLRQRLPFYKRADYFLEIEGNEPGEQIAGRIIRLIHGEQ
ncbi:shikimate kinase [candidate division KSB1 bacterium]|nr:shikimate kinase [candidate division KSB1 bacterium]